MLSLRELRAVANGEPTKDWQPMTVDPASVRPYPFEEDAALVFADYAGPSSALSPREVLKRQIARADKMGLTVKAALELMGLVGGEIRLPLTPITDANRECLQLALKDFGILK